MTRETHETKTVQEYLASSDCDEKNKTEYIQPCTQSFIDIGSLTLKKETMKHCRRTLVFVKQNVESYFCCLCFR